MRLLVLFFGSILVSAVMADEAAKSKRWLEVKTAGVNPFLGGADRERTTIADDEVVLTVQKVKYDPSGSAFWDDPIEKRLKLDRNQASKLWSEIDRLRIFDWHDSYSPEDVGTEVHDGTYWSVSIEVDGRSKYSDGINTYPLREPFAAPTVDVTKPTAFHKLRQLLRPLKDAAKQSPEPALSARNSS